MTAYDIIADLKMHIGAQQLQIERLTAELEEYKQCYREDGLDTLALKAERDRLLAAIKIDQSHMERLRAALEDILAYADDPEARANRGLSIAQYAVAIAREALAGRKPE